MHHVLHTVLSSQRAQIEAAALAATGQKSLDNANRSKSAAEVKASALVEKAVRGVFKQYAADRMAIELQYTKVDSDYIRAAESCLKACEMSMKAGVPLCGGLKFQQLLFAEFEEWLKRISKGHGDLLGSADQVHNMLCHPDFSSTVLLHALRQAMNPQRIPDQAGELEISHKLTDMWKAAMIVVIPVVWWTGLVVCWIWAAIGCCLYLMLLSEAHDARQSAAPSTVCSRPSSYRRQSAACYSSASAHVAPYSSSSSASDYVAPSSSYSSSSSPSSGTIFKRGPRGGLMHKTCTGNWNYVSHNRPARASRLIAEAERG
jgi:hypothetical protein